jgi:hypothetical protein
LYDGRAADPELSMSFQLILTLIVVALASCYLLYRALRAWKAAAGGCAGGCGCPEKAEKSTQTDAFIPLTELKLRQDAPDRP